MYPAFLDDERQIAPARAVRTQFVDGSFTLRSPMALQPYARCVGEWLERWAKETPDALALAERSDGAEGWRSLTYAQLRRQVGAVAQSLLDLRLPAGRPIAILSDNAVDHAVLMHGSHACGHHPLLAVERIRTLPGPQPPARHAVGAGAQSGLCIRCQRLCASPARLGQWRRAGVQP